MKMAFFLLLTTTTLLAEVSKDDVGGMLDQMVRDNVISPKEAHKARLRLKNLSTQEWSQLNAQAKSVANRGPASIATPETEKIDLDSAQLKQIEEDIKKIVPQN